MVLIANGDFLIARDDVDDLGRNIAALFGIARERVVVVVNEPVQIP